MLLIPWQRRSPRSFLSNESMRTTLITLFTLAFVSSFGVRAVADDNAGITFFEKKIRPVLVAKCYKCHNSKKRARGGLILDSKDGLLEGGDTGPAIVPKHPEKSLLIAAMEYKDPLLEMPPSGKLPNHVIEDFKKWIKMGAPDPRTGDQTAKKTYGIDIEKGRKFWAFQLPKRPPLPNLKNEKWAHGPIDRFVLAKLESKGFQPVADTDRRTLIRRAYFALIGLPPSPKQIDNFVNDKSPKAFEKVVDELLASPHFGERWARHWLDIARFAESTGGGRSMLFPDAWRYRDYVIHAFNSDKSYAQFLKEQIAGDLLEAKSDQERYWQLVATAYLLLGPTNYELQDKPVLESDVIDEQIDSLGRAMMGMTIGCARCHDHKFDPIPQKDYYALAGIFKNTKSLVHSNVSKWMTRPLPMSGKLEKVVEEHKKAVAALQAKIREARKVAKKNGRTPARGPLSVKELPGVVVDDLKAKQVGEWKKSTYMNTFIGKNYVYASPGGPLATLTFTPNIPKSGKYEVRLAFLVGSNRAVNAPIDIHFAGGKKQLRINQTRVPSIDGRFYPLGQFQFEKGKSGFVQVSNKGAKGGVVVADAVQFIPVEELKAKPKVAKKQPKKEQPKYNLAKLQKQLKKLQKNGPNVPRTMAVADMENVKDFYICVRGVVHNKGPTVPRGVLQVATIGKMPTIPKNASGRLQLAKWLTSPKHPLTARVMVNRIWHHLFGNGIVKTVDNFGSTGDRPSHPELLDYLAVQFVEQNWSMKKLIREIMLSRTYQLSSRQDPNDPNVQKAVKADPSNRLLWRQNRKRLEAEVIRDAVLTVSGELDLKAGGRSTTGNVNESNYNFPGKRRSVYTPVFRNNLLELFQVFDFADPNLVVGARASSTVAPQALYLMNSPFVMEQAQKAAKRTLAKKMNTSDRIEYAYQLTLGRDPTGRERDLVSGYLQKTQGNPETAWEQVYQALFASIDFRYVN